ncbi:MAG: hypothetical protein EAX95_11915 [Candidatus Thorarchaeota archaeon]|nr:hypothetical protein [Candidatus Thorarchaeota archaeon]
MFLICQIGRRRLIRRNYKQCSFAICFLASQRNLTWWLIMKTILIAYGTRYGSTEEVAERIKAILEEHDCSVHLLDVKSVKEKKWPSLQNYNGVIVGSSIKMMKWMKEPKRFLQKYQRELNSADKILGVFVSSMGAAIPNQRQEIHDKCISEVMHELRIQPAISDAFGGVFDFSPSSRMGSIDKRMARFAAMAMNEESDLRIDTDARNDFRDWDQIRDFAERFQKLLNSEA